MKNISKILSIALLLGLTACKKDTKEPEPEPTPTTPTQTYGSLKLEFENMVDTNALTFNTNYINQKGDTFKITTFKYYISNIVVTKNDNSTFIEPNSYHLVDHANSATSVITLTNVPTGSYKSVSFVLGVDSARSAGGATVQVGDLASSGNMYWAWNSGYIMLKLEGTAPKSGASSKALTYHIGGYSGVNKAQRNFTFNFSSTTANVSTAVTPEIHMQADVLELFKTPNIVDVTTLHTVHMPGATAKTMADNYADMIHFEHVHND
ncbi:MAG: MbnP family protein [Bacteroidota bacterium]|nr:MbnP family protein [Bacteroidota bacterium]